MPKSNFRKRLTSVDLFCGAGGITEGFRQAGFSALYANDIDSDCITTFKRNHPDTRAEAKPIEEVDAVELRSALGLKTGELDVLVGGPPCQGFSINAPERFMDDPRNALFKHYVRFLDDLRPKTFLFENVPGMLSIAGGKIFQRIESELGQHGYRVASRVLFAPHYGVPQERWRVIILGTRIDRPLTHPLPTHYATGRANFTKGGTMTFRLSEQDRMSLKPYVSIKDALYDLPRLGIKDGDEEMAYSVPPHSEYARLMREGSGVLFNHTSGYLSPQNLERLKHVKPGGSWRDIPHELLPKGMQRARRSDHTKRYGRLTWDGMSGTVLTKCDPHWGTVFLPDQDRTLTPREAARLQSFPDRYRFLGSRVSQYMQIGNAVPVRMARAIAHPIADHLSG